MLVIFSFFTIALLCFPCFAEIVSYIDDNGIIRIENTSPRTPDSGKRSCIRQFTPQINQDGLAQYASIIDEICTRYEIDDDLVKAIIQIESNYCYDAISPKGAIGLMQLMPATAARFGVEDIYDPSQNIEGGVKYLLYLIKFFKGDIDLVLAAYNAGEHKVLEHNGIPPFEETNRFVQRVLAIYHKLSGSGSLTPEILVFRDANGVINMVNMEAKNYRKR